MLIAGQHIKEGETKIINLNIARLYDYTELSLPVKVIRGSKPGPTLFVSGAIHGDEIIGTEIIKRLLSNRSIDKICGTLIAIPIVNIFGFNVKSRYLPDRRDLNRSFPGSKRGSLAAQIANLFINEIVKKCDYGIDLHSAAVHRTNLPQLRTNLSNLQAKELAEVFGVPVVVNSKFRDGSLRQAADELGVTTLLFEGGEALRIDDATIKIGLKGILDVMKHIGMLKNKSIKKKKKDTFYAEDSHWIRAGQSGILTPQKKAGQIVERGDILGLISDPFGTNRFEIKARSKGIIIGNVTMPLINKGDALFHIATVEDLGEAKRVLNAYPDLITDDSDHNEI